jgi:hypothetical protein
MSALRVKPVGMADILRVGFIMADRFRQKGGGRGGKMWKIDLVIQDWLDGGQVVCES